MSTILIVEDEPEIAAFVSKGLQNAGYSTIAVGTGAQALDELTAPVPDLVILDLGLPDMEGIEVLKRIRDRGSRIPVVILTARSSVPDTVAGLDSGADDYMPKPFCFDELLARVRRRILQAREGTVVLTHGDLSLDLRTRRATVRDRQVELTAREFALAEIFLRRPGEIVSREELLSKVWGFDFDPGSNVVEVYVRYLRRKIGPQFLETVRGKGYRLA